MVFVALAACSSALLLFTSASFGSDWRFAGYNKQGKSELYQFFDADYIDRPAKDIARVWVKAVTVKNLDRYYEAHQKDVVEKAATKIATGYAPRFFLLATVRRGYADKSALNEAAATATGYEVIANAPTVQPITKIYFEIDCKGRRIRHLDGVVYDAKGDVVPQNPSRKVPNYSFIIPETNGDWLSQLVCP
ncbi:MAG TPA: hypothetical protein VN929_17090 [Burkholderiales bacterium]|nr:hypothetical protein [Burkholderiales bacterium]